MPAASPTAPGSVPAVGSSEFIVLRPGKSSDVGLSAETLLIFLRSPAVQTILKWSQTGSTHPRFERADLLSIPVPDRLIDIAPQIDADVTAALTARREAADLLEQAKRRVEELIEAGE